MPDPPYVVRLSGVHDSRGNLPIRLVADGREAGLPLLARVSDVDLDHNAFVLFETV